MMLFTGNRFGPAGAQIVAVDDDGRVHFVILSASLEKNGHILRRPVV